MSCTGYKWYSGVPHCHTVASDGALTLEQVIEKAKKSKIDFLIITDHNVNCKDFPKVDGLTLIYGAELTKHGGIGTGHGGPSIQERMTFVVMNKEWN